MYLNIDVPASINTSFKSPLSSMWLFAFFYYKMEATCYFEHKFF